MRTLPHKSPFEELKENLSNYGFVTSVCEGNQFTLRVRVYEKDNATKIVDMISKLFHSLGVSHTIGEVKGNIVCSWEIRRR